MYVIRKKKGKEDRIKRNTNISPNIITLEELKQHSSNKKSCRETKSHT